MVVAMLGATVESKGKIIIFVINCWSQPCLDHKLINQLKEKKNN